MNGLNNLTVLFLGYGRTETKLIQAIEELGHIVEHTHDKILNLSKFDVVVSYGYRHILKKDVLSSSKRPVINLHISYLPYNRGAHPNFWSFFDNTPSGVSIHEIDEGIDTGPIVYQKYVNFDHEETTFSATYTRLVTEIEKLFLDNINCILYGKYLPRPQRSKGTYHSTKDLPKVLQDWNVDIYQTIDSLTKATSSNYNRDMALVNEIESVRSGNNVNWMDLLRIGLKYAPTETKKVLNRINLDDMKISELFKELAK